MADSQASESPAVLPRVPGVWDRSKVRLVSTNPIDHALSTIGPVQNRVRLSDALISAFD